MLAENINFELFECTKGNSSLKIDIIKLDTFMCVCEECGSNFETDDIRNAYCAPCWNILDAPKDEQDEQYCPYCSAGCDYCLMLEPRSWRD